MPTEKEVDEIKSKMTEKKTKEPTNVYLGSGSTLLNLACSGRPNGCFAKGNYCHIVGDSDTGKSVLALTAFAEATINKQFDNYDFLFYAPEAASLDLLSSIGTKAQKRLEIIEGLDSLEEFYDHLDNRIHKKPCIAVLDSMDALDAQKDQEKLEEEKKAREKDKETSGSYGTNKARTNHSRLRVVNNLLGKNGSIFLIISQTKDNIGFGSQFDPKTYSGGKALKFYSKLQIWLSHKGDIKKTHKDKDYQVGITAKCHVRKNHQTGRKGAVDINIYHNPRGFVDDIGSCIDWLQECNHWKGTKAKVGAPEFEHSGSKEKLISKIEAEDLEVEFRSLVTKVWNDIEEATSVQRKNKYE